MPNATTALNTVVRSWQRHYKPGPEHRILTLSVAYGSTKKLLRQVSSECGAQLDEAVVEFPLPDEGPVLDALSNALCPETKLVVLDAVPSNAPFVLPLEEAVALCRKKSPDAFVIIDGAHALGGLPLNLRRPLADAFVTNCHKWFCGPKGSALLHIREEHQSWLHPLSISHGFGSDTASGFYWTGLSDFTSWLALDSVLEFWDVAGFDSQRIYSQYMAINAAEMLTDAWGTDVGVPLHLIGPMALVELPVIPALGSGSGMSYEQAEIVQNALYRRSIEVPVKALSGRLYVRISAHIYNHIEEYEVLRDAVLELSRGAEL